MQLIAHDDWGRRRDAFASREQALSATASCRGQLPRPLQAPKTTARCGRGAGRPSGAALRQPKSTSARAARALSQPKCAPAASRSGSRLGRWRRAWSSIFTRRHSNRPDTAPCAPWRAGAWEAVRRYAHCRPHPRASIVLGRSTPCHDVWIAGFAWLPAGARARRHLR